MNELQLVFLFDTALGFVVIASISAIAFGKSRLWVVGHASFLATGGVYALGAQIWPVWLAILAALAALIAWATLLSLAAAFLEGDRFVVVSLGSAYATYATFFARFGDGLRDVPGAVTPAEKSAIFSLLLVIILGLSIYIHGLSKSSINTILLLARDHPELLQSSGLSVRPIRFWIHMVSALPIGVAGILMVAFYQTYSPNAHAAPLCLLLFVVGIPFGTNTLGGSAAAALCLSGLMRAVSLALSSELANSAYEKLAIWSGRGGVAETASNLSEPLTQLLLAALFIVLIRILPEGLFGKETIWVRR